MFDDTSIQKDDKDTLSNSKPLYHINPSQIRFQLSKIQHLLNYTIQKYLSKDNDQFKEFWKLDDIPEKSQFFYHHYPKVSTNYESDHHVANYGIFLNHFYLVRWLPDTLQHLFIPLRDLNLTNDETSQLKKLSAKGMPTINECRLCEQFKGESIWNRNGEWFCVYTENTPNVKPENVFKLLNDKDELGFKFFNKFEELYKWKKSFNERLQALERKAFVNCKNLKQLRDVELELERLNTLKKSNESVVRPNEILTIKG